MPKAGSMTFVMNSLAYRVKLERETLGLTQPELAKKAGVSQGSISLIEAGERKQPRSLLAIAAALNVTAEWLESGKGHKHPSAAPAGGATLYEVTEERIGNPTPPIQWPFDTITAQEWQYLPKSRRDDVEDHIKMLISKYGRNSVKTAA